MPSRLNNRNYNRQHRIRGQPREPSPAPLPDPPLTGPDGPEESADDPELNWYYGQDAGGFEVTFGKHRGKDLNELPYSYLKWCSSNLLDARALRSAIEKYSEGLKQWLSDGNYGELAVPIGRTYKGQALKKCRDKEWMQWLVDRAPPALKERHELFFLAIAVWLANPPHQLAHRDIGESLSKSKYQDDLNLDLEEGEEFDDDANENGDLEGFVEPDEDEESEEKSDSEGDDSDGEEGQSTSGSSHSDDDESDEESGTLPSGVEDDNSEKSHSMPASGIKRKRSIVLDSDLEEDYERTSAHGQWIFPPPLA
ncbi:hypothetical protein FA13DRAFT_1790198 [Coprinellus micaceus]|uniref:Uncharacterized protein n=1 Tax=Coprinellus micaceus TaxID=71717 RepID=A0A4Y7TG44_COPMI|nr:hypothetical protein FA13DRAFT_1790198 [Coprinellus micaceus]